VPGVLVAIGQDAARLDGHRGEARVAEAMLDHHVGLGEAPGRVADGGARHHRDVLGPAGVGRGRPARVGHRGQRRARLVVHDDEVGGVLREGGRLGHRDRDGLAHVADDVGRQHGLRPRARRRASAVAAAAQGPRGLRQVGGGPRREHAGQRAGRRQVHAAHAGVRVHAAHHRHVRLAGAPQVVHEPPRPRQEPEVFLPPRRLP
jgi:hypothetical protein